MRRFIFALFLLGALIIVGTLGYSLIEGWSALDSLYMTVISLTTTGYKEVHPLTPRGAMFTILMLATGVGLFAYTLGVFVHYVMEGELKGFFSKRKMEKNIAKIENHYIVCGFGRTGKIVAGDLKSQGVTVVVVEKNETLREYLESEGYLYVIGDATSDEVLGKAGIVKAKGVITVLNSDADNLFITISARQLNPGLHLIVKGNTPGIERKLEMAGADRVVMPHLIGGKLISHSILMPHVTDFVELTTQRSRLSFLLQEVRVDERSAMNGSSLKELDLNRRTGVIVLAVKKPDGEMMVNPAADYRFETQDILIVLGTQDQVRACMNMLEVSGS